MSKITEIKMEGFKGHNCIQPLSGLDIFVGPNGSGKSSRIEAILFALLGYIPNKSKILSDIFKYSSGLKMTTGIKTDQGFQTSRSVLKKTVTKRNGEIEEQFKEDIILTPSLGEKNLTQKRERVLNEMGNFPIMLDFQNFLNQSDNEKRKFIYSLSGAEDTVWNKEKVEKYLKNNLDIIEEKENISNILNELMQHYPVKYDIETAIQSLIDYSNNKLIYWKEEKKNTEGFIKKLSVFKKETNILTGNIIEDKKNLDNLQLELINLEKIAAVIDEKERNNKIIQDKILRLEKELNNTNLEFRKKNDIKRIKERIEILKKTIIPINFEKQIEEKQTKINNLKENLKVKRKILNDIVISGKEKKVEIKTNQKLINSIKNQKGVCFLNNRISCNKDFSKFMSHIEKLIDKDSKEKNGLGQKYLSLSNEIKRQEKELELLEKESSRLIQEERKANKKNNDIKAEINTLSSQLISIEKDTEINKSKFNMKKEELNSLKQQLDLNTDTKKNNDINKKINEIKVEIIRLKTSVEQYEKIKGNLENLKKANIQNKKAISNIAILKKIIVKLGPTGIQGEILKDNLKPMEDNINKNLKVLGVNNKFFFQCKSDKGKEIFKFGWIKNNEKINFETLSDGEQAILLTAFLVAVIEKKEPNIKILAIDKIEAIDSQNLQKLISGLKILKKNLDNIILCGRMEQKVLDLAKNKGFKINKLNGINNIHQVEEFKEDII